MVLWSCNHMLGIMITNNILIIMNIIIDHIIRMNQARKRYEEALFHIITIQSFIRKHLSMRNLNKLLKAGVLFQALGITITFYYHIIVNCNHFLVRTVLMRKEKDIKIHSIKKIQVFSSSLIYHDCFNYYCQWLFIGVFSYALRV